MIVPVQDDSTFHVVKDLEPGKVPPLPKEVLFAERLKNSKELKSVYRKMPEHL